MLQPITSASRAARATASYPERYDRFSAVCKLNTIVRCNLLVMPREKHSSQRIIVCAMQQCLVRNFGIDGME